MPRWSFIYRSALCVVAALIIAGCPTTAPDPQPEANFDASPRSGNTGTTVSFSDQSSTVTGGPILSWQWDFGDGGRSSLPNPTHTYLTSGDFTVTLTVVSSGGSHTRTRPGYIRIDSPTGSEQLDGGGGSVTSNGVSINIPEGALAGRVDFGITRVATEIPFNVFEPINRVGDTFRITHNSATALSTSTPEVPFQTARLSIPYAEDVVPTGSRIPARVHIIAQLETGEVIPIPGNIGSGTVDAQVRDLPRSALYTVVYRPEAYLVSVSVGDTKAPTSTSWSQRWEVSLSPTLLNQLTALRLGSILQASSFFATNFTEAQLQATEDALLDGLIAAQQAFEGVLARSPRLVAANGAYSAMCYNFVQQYPTAIGSLNNVMYAGSPFGGIVLDPQQLLSISAWNADRFRADGNRVDIAQILSADQAIGEVLARAVVGGYDFPAIAAMSPADGGPVNFSAGIEAGLALHIGQLLGGQEGNRSQLPGDRALLSTPVFAPFDLSVPGYGAAGQDFFRYVANRYAPSPALGYIAGGSGAVKGLLEEVRLALGSLLSPSFADAALLTAGAIDEAMYSRLGVSLGEAYYNYVLDLAFEHGAPGVLRPSDADRLPLVFDASRFAPGTILAGNLESPGAVLTFPLGAQTALTGIAPLSARAVIVGVNPADSPVDFSFNRADWGVDDRGQGVEIAVYRNGLQGIALPASESTLTLADFEADLGETMAFFHVLVINTSTSTASNVTLTVARSTAE